jgi:hypothetical protein
MALENEKLDENEEEEDWIPTREEKERYVIYLHQKHKSYREIARVVHVSFSDISKIIREHYGYPEPQKDESQLSNETRALKLFDENKRPVDVAIQLGIPSDNAIIYFQKYQQLTRLSMDENCLKLSGQIQNLESERYNLECQLGYLRNQITDESRTLEYYKQQCEQTTNELVILYQRKNDALGIS